MKKRPRKLSKRTSKAVFNSPAGKPNGPGWGRFRKLLIDIVMMLATKEIAEMVTTYIHTGI